MTAEKAPAWLTQIQVLMLHSESIQLFGGRPGVRDAGLLESALGRPKNKCHSDPGLSLFDLAAANAFGIARNHPFMDGNKRAGLLAIRVFLFTNGYAFDPEETETVTVIEGLAAGSIDEDALAGWIKANAAERMP